MTLPATAMDSPANPWVFLAWFGCLCCVYMYGQGLLLLRRQRQRSARSKIRTAGSGPIFVGGWVEGATTLTAAVSGKPCHYYRAAVWRQRDSVRDDSWETVAEEIQGKPFVLNDKSGYILVDPRGAEVDLLRDTHEEYGKTLLATHTDIPPALEAFLKRNKVDTTAALRVEEYLLPPGAEIFVHGFAATNPDLLASSGPSAKEKKNDPRKAAGTNPASPSKPVPQQVIHLSPEPVNRPASQMTMQARVAAALALARVQSADAMVRNPLHIPSISVAIAETTGSLEARATKKSEDKQERQQPLVGGPAVPSPLPQLPQPPLVLRQQDGSRFTISYRSQCPADLSSIRWTTALLVGGPLITLASAYFLLANLGWL